MKILYLDCFSGVSGDMMLGALSELVGDFDVLRQGLDALDEPTLSVSRHEVMRAGLGATKVDVNISGEEAGGAALLADDPRHSHHSHGGHRTFADIRKVIEGSRLAPSVRDRSLAVFRRLVEAEARVHRMPPDEVHLHEVGALDAIADVVGAVLLIDRLAPERIVSSPLNLGGGSIACEHGDYPVPGPATALLTEGVPVWSSGSVGELTTPTGAALIAEVADAFGPLPPMTTRSIGLGAGSRNTDRRPNVLRAFLGDALPAGASQDAEIAAAMGSAGESGRTIVVECTIDDMNPQNYGYLTERLSGSGAVEVYLTPVHMKKDRPGVLVTALCRPDALNQVTEAIFSETTTIGLRYRRENRLELDRRSETVETAYGTVRIKVSGKGGKVFNAHPEYDDCRRLAAEHGVPLKEVQGAAAEAWRRRTGPDEAAASTAARADKPGEAASPTGRRSRRTS